MPFFLAPLCLWIAFVQPENALKDFVVLKRTGVTETLDLVIAMGGERPGPWWDTKHKLGLFLQEKAHPERVSLLTANLGPLECAVRVERVTASETVIACDVEKGGREINQKYTYDVRERKLLTQFTYRPFAFNLAFPAKGVAILVGSDTERSIAVECNLDQATPTFRILGGKEEQMWPNSMSLEDGKKTAPPMPPLPRTTFEQFATARPQRVKDGYSREAAQIDDSVGPWEMEGRVIWFAKNFPDEEGTTGVGGFGYFNLETRKFHMIQPPEILNWSVSAMNVAPGAVWLSLVRNGEYGSDGGGLLRYDRHSGTILRLPLKDVTSQLVRHGDTLVAATFEGIAIVKSNHVNRYFVDRTADGKLKISRANI